MTAGLSRVALDVQAPVHRRVHELDEFLAQQGLDVLRVPRAHHLDAFAERVHELHGRFGAEIGQQQGFLDLVPDVFVDLVRREQGQQALAQDVVGLDQPLAQPDQPPGHRQRGFHRDGFQPGGVVRDFDGFRFFEFDARPARSVPVPAPARDGPPQGFRLAGACTGSFRHAGRVVRGALPGLHEHRNQHTEDHQDSENGQNEWGGCRSLP